MTILKSVILILPMKEKNLPTRSEATISLRRNSDSSI